MYGGRTRAADADWPAIPSIRTCGGPSGRWTPRCAEGCEDLRAPRSVGAGRQRGDPLRLCAAEVLVRAALPQRRRHSPRHYARLGARQRPARGLRAAPHLLPPPPRAKALIRPLRRRARRRCRAAPCAPSTIARAVFSVGEPSREATVSPTLRPHAREPQPARRRGRGPRRLTSVARQRALRGRVRALGPC